MPEWRNSRMERAERSGCLLIALEMKGQAFLKRNYLMLQIGSFVVGTGAHQAAVFQKEKVQMIKPHT
jgi:hypothetical protein